MVLHSLRASTDRLLSPVARRLAHRGVSPDIVTWLSIPFSAAAAVAILASSPTRAAQEPFLVAAFLAVSAASILDMLDGQVARLSRRASVRGDYLDHVVDRFSDTMLIVAIALSPFANATLGMLALSGVLLTSYLGTQAQAVGIGRNYRGMLGRADRQVALLLAILLDQVAAWAGWVLPMGWVPAAVPSALVPVSFMALLLLWFGVVGNLTAIQRFAQGLTWFSRNGTDSKRGAKR